jgi:predicted component of type VI protein secretion system
MPAKLVLSLNKTVLEEFPLTKERMTIGRKSGNDVQIDNLAVSGRHAAITTILNDSFIEDLESTNGTFVNNSLLSKGKKHALRNGDTVSIGKYELKYCNDYASDENDFEKTMVIRPGMASHAAAQAKVQQHQQTQTTTAQIPESAALGKLQVLSGPGAGKEFDLTKPLITLGRPGVQVAVITRRSKGYFITHVEGSRPVVNGKPIGDHVHALTDHDIIDLAGVRLEFFVPG